MIFGSISLSFLYSYAKANFSVFTDQRASKQTNISNTLTQKLMLKIFPEYQKKEKKN